MIRLSARPSDSLDWNIAPDATSIMWHLDLGLEEGFFPLEDEMRFQSLTLALEKFGKEIWPRFQDKTKGVILYRGNADFSLRFSWSERQQENWKLWLEERPPAPIDHQRRLFCADAFAHYFQMLSHKLPDELPIYLFLDGSNAGTLAQRHQLLSRERFDHFHLALKGVPNSNRLIWEGEKVNEPPLPPTAICFPEEGKCSGDILNQLDNLMNSLPEYRVIPEAFLTEEWDGVDILHVIKEALTSQGERKLQGFCAAGGTVHS